MQNIFEIIKPQRLLGCLPKSSKRLVNKNYFTVEEKNKTCITDLLIQMASSTYYDLNFSLSLDTNLCLLKSVTAMARTQPNTYQEIPISSTMTVRLRSKRTFAYPSTWSREAEGKRAFWTLSSALPYPSNTRTRSLVHAEPKQMVLKRCFELFPSQDEMQNV